MLKEPKTYMIELRLPTITNMNQSIFTTKSTILKSTTHPPSLSRLQSEGDIAIIGNFMISKECTQFLKRINLKFLTVLYVYNK